VASVRGSVCGRVGSYWVTGKRWRVGVHGRGGIPRRISIVWRIGVSGNAGNWWIGGEGGTVRGCGELLVSQIGVWPRP
jgi:hypothetical protein